ncbi:DUF6265 family protein [Sphingoaurantiacus capsulatus]|uniref:DUF6265 family protein n=1 Tax=Sphingoaurantiacus capsulatus TaxID=1771310 RepID=A0ABV7XCH8_9SPHN
MTMWAVAALVAPSPAYAAETRSAVPGAPSPKATLADLQWMVGTWEGEGLGGAVRESYSPPAGGQMVGHFRSLRDGKPAFYELVMLAEVDGSLEYRVKHFNPDMTAWEEKAQVVRFPLVAVEKDVWYFNGLTIRRTGPDSVTHFVRIGSKDGKTSEAGFTYRRVKP